MYIPFKNEQFHWLTFNLCLLLKQAFSLTTRFYRRKNHSVKVHARLDSLIRYMTAPVSVESNFMINIPNLTGNVFKSLFEMHI